MRRRAKVSVSFLEMQPFIMVGSTPGVNLIQKPVVRAGLRRREEGVGQDLIIEKSPALAGLFSVTFAVSSCRLLSGRLLSRLWRCRFGRLLSLNDEFATIGRQLPTFTFFQRILGKPPVRWISWKICRLPHNDFDHTLFLGSKLRSEPTIRCRSCQMN